MSQTQVNERQGHPENDRDNSPTNRRKRTHGAPLEFSLSRHPICGRDVFWNRPKERRWRGGGERFCGLTSTTRCEVDDARKSHRNADGVKMPEWVSLSAKGLQGGTG